MRGAVFGLLLTLAGCGQAPVADNRSAVPPMDEANLIMPDMNATTAMPPSQSTGQTGPGQMPDTGDGPRDRFIVCPGNPRCPPEGSQPKGRQDADH